MEEKQENTALPIKSRQSNALQRALQERSRRLAMESRLAPSTLQTACLEILAEEP
jgi:hypothetical protein